MVFKNFKMRKKPQPHLNFPNYFGAGKATECPLFAHILAKRVY